MSTPGASIAAASRARMELQQGAVELNGVVVGDGAPILEATDALFVIKLNTRAPILCKAKAEFARYIRREVHRLVANRHQLPKVRRLLFEAFAWDWHRAGNWKPRTKETFEMILRRRLFPDFCGTTLSAITPADIEAYRANLKETAVRQASMVWRFAAWERV